jgi:hypothetical protein
VARIAIVFGLLLIALGGGTYAYAVSTRDNPSPTPLIATGFGVALVLLGLLATRDNLRKHAMHAAAAVGLLGALGGVIAIFIPVFKGNGLGDLFAFWVKLAMAVLCLAFVGLCVNSFVQARRRRAAAP